MPKISKSSNKKNAIKAKKASVVIKKISTPENKVKAPIKISKNYTSQKILKNICVISTYPFSK